MKTWTENAKVSFWSKVDQSAGRLAGLWSVNGDTSRTAIRVLIGAKYGNETYAGTVGGSSR